MVNTSWSWSFTFHKGTEHAALLWCGASIPFDLWSTETHLHACLPVMTLLLCVFDSDIAVTRSAEHV